MARRILNRKELRAENDAAERRKQDDEQDENEEEGEDEDEEDEEEDEEGSDKDEEEEGEAEASEDEEEKPAPKKKKKPARAPAKTKPRSRAAKITRMRVVWGVFNNSNQCVATYQYPKKAEAIEHAGRLTSDKRSTHFVQPVKEPMEEPKEAKEK